MDATMTGRSKTTASAERIVLMLKAALIVALIVVILRWTRFDIDWPVGDWFYARLNLSNKQPAIHAVRTVATTVVTP